MATCPDSWNFPQSITKQNCVLFEPETKLCIELIFQLFGCVVVAKLLAYWPSQLKIWIWLIWLNWNWNKDMPDMGPAIRPMWVIR